MTPKVVSNSLMNSLSSIKVSSLKASRSSEVLSFAMIRDPSCCLPQRALPVVLPRVRYPRVSCSLPLRVVPRPRRVLHS